MAETFPRHYTNPYDTCTQCGYGCVQSCFGGNCDYRERASSNRYVGYPTGYEKCPRLPVAYADKSASKIVLERKCAKVAPMWYCVGENGVINHKQNNHQSYLKYDAIQPSYVGVGLMRGHQPVGDYSFTGNKVSYKSL